LTAIAQHLNCLGDRLEALFIASPIIILFASFGGGEDLPLVGGYCSYFAAGALFAMKRARSNWLINSVIVLCLFEALHFSAGSHLGQEDLARLSPITLSFIITAFYFFFFLFNHRESMLSCASGSSFCWGNYLPTLSDPSGYWMYDNLSVCQ
jgi:hypothetical protein